MHATFWLGTEQCSNRRRNLVPDESGVAPVCMTHVPETGAGSENGVDVWRQFLWWMVWSWWMAGYRGNQPILDRQSHCSSSWLQLTSTSVDKLKPFQNRSGTMCCKSCSLAQDTRPIL